MTTWSEVLKSILLSHEQLLMGWLLGMLSPAVVEAVRRRRRLKQLERAIALELHELHFIMVLKAFVIRQRAARLDDEFLSWYEEALSGYKGPKPKQSMINLSQALRKLPADRRGEVDPKRGLTLSEGDAALLGIHANEIALFPIRSQVALQSIMAQLKIYNQQVAYLRRLFDKTFDDLTEINRTNVRQNLEEGYGYLAERSVAIAKEIQQLPTSLKL